jgi:hypothetical protein
MPAPKTVSRTNKRKLLVDLLPYIIDLLLKPKSALDRIDGRYLAADVKKLIATCEVHKTVRKAIQRNGSIEAQYRGAAPEED